LQQAVQITETLSEAVDGTGFVIEAVTEDPEVKRNLFCELDQLLPEGAILASNTSYLNIFPLVPARRQSKTLIVHWYTPPYIINLVDIVPGPATDPAVLAHVKDVVIGLGQVPVVLRSFVPGYIANRIQSAITHEALQLLDSGIATRRGIDDAIVHGLALRLPILGHLAKADFTGLDPMRRAMANGTYAQPPARSRSQTLDELCAAGRTG
jgi:3-hydroxybutyryl-CoA dehydrogenase